MKIKSGLIIKEIDKEYVLIDSGIEPPIFNGLIKLNKTGKDIVELLSSKEYTYEELINALLDKYDVGKEELISSISQFLEELRKVKLLNG